MYHLAMGDRPSFTSEDAAGLQLGPGAVCALVTGALVLIGVCQKAWGYVPILDGANLLFHEAGHPIYGIFGSTLGLWGGTLGQLTFPAVVAITSWRRQQSAGVTLGATWFFENGLNIAPYVADARSRALPLVGGMDHDWFNILFMLDALASDTAIARTIVFVSWVGMLSVWLWSFWRWQVPKR